MTLDTYSNRTMRTVSHTAETMTIILQSNGRMVFIIELKVQYFQRELPCK